MNETDFTIVTENLIFKKLDCVDLAENFNFLVSKKILTL